MHAGAEKDASDDNLLTFDVFCKWFSDVLKVFKSGFENPCVLPWISGSTCVLGVLFFLCKPGSVSWSDVWESGFFLNKTVCKPWIHLVTMTNISAYTQKRHIYFTF